MAASLDSIFHRNFIGVDIRMPLAAANTSEAALEDEIDWAVAYQIDGARPNFSLPDEEFERCEARVSDMLRRVEALPLTAYNARLKARAIYAIHAGTFAEFGSDDRSGACADVRLARQVLASLVGDA